MANHRFTEEREREREQTCIAGLCMDELDQFKYV